MPDAPLGPIGEMIGLGVDDPEFPPDEIVVWAAKANRFQGIRAVGGRIYLTDRRLVFAPNDFERGIPDLLAGGYLSRKLARSAPKVGFQTTLPRSTLFETRVESRKVPYGAQGASFM